jgi:hypothetical protein
MKKLFMAFGLLISLTSVAGGDDDYAVSKISPVLSKDVNVVVRREEQKFEMKGLDKAVEYYRVVYTIFNENGDEYAGLTVLWITSIPSTSWKESLTRMEKDRSMKKGDIADKAVIVNLQMIVV